MKLHSTSGKWQLGAGLSLVTCFMWGILPVALAIVVKKLDPYTLCWFRFLVAFICLGIYLAQGKKLVIPQQLPRNYWILLGISAIFLAFNYQFFLTGLKNTSASNAEVLIQMAPVFFGLASLLIFRERYSLLQWSGLAILIAGLIAYSHDQLQMLMSSPDQYLLGNTLLALGAFTWAIYALAQKQLLEKLPSTIIMWFIYGICLLLFTPMARPLTILSLNGLELSLLIFSGFNTLIAYGAFSEALEHLEASRVSAILAITPLVTLISVDLLSLWFPAWVAAEPISMIGIIGAILVVVGAIATTMGKQEKVKIEQ